MRLRTSPGLMGIILGQDTQLLSQVEFRGRFYTSFPKHLMRKYLPAEIVFWSYLKASRKNIPMKNNMLIRHEGNGHGQDGGYLWGWGKGGGLADGGEGLVVEQGVAAAGEDAQVVDRAVRSDGEGDFHLAAPSASWVEQGIVELVEDGVADGGEVGVAVDLFDGNGRDSVC